MKTNYARKQLLKSFLMLLFAGVFISGLHAQVSGDYRSKNSGDYSEATSWEKYNGSDWADAGSAPGYLNNVTIQAGHIITITSDAPTYNYCQNLTIETDETVGDGQLITSGSGRYLYIQGDQIVVNGTLGKADGTDLTYILTSNDCTISGTGIIKFVTLQVGQGTNLNLNTDVTLTGTGLYTYQSGTVTIMPGIAYTGNLLNSEIADCTVELIIKGKILTSSASSSIRGFGAANTQGTLTIFSDEHVTGQLQYTPYNSAYNNVDIKLQRYIAGHNDPTGASDAGWHLFASPVDNFDWSGTAWNPATSGNKDDLFGWDEINYEWSNGRDWATKSFELEKGYLVAYQNTTTQQVSGTMNVSDVSVDLTYTSGQGEGWNLLGNPFTCALDWDDFTIPANVSGTVYVYDEATQDYISWNGTEGDLTDGIIPVSNAFFVKASAAVSGFTIPEAARTLGNTDFYKSSAAGSFKAILNFKGMSNNTWYSHKTDASPEYDEAYDAFNLHSMAKRPEIYSRSSNGDELMVNATNNVERITTGIIIYEEGQYKLTFEGIDAFEEKLFLRDLKTGEKVSLNDETVYEFAASPKDVADRFEIGTFKDATGIEELVQKLDVLYNGQELIFGQTPDIATLEVFDLSGRKIHTQQIQGQNRIALKLPNGVYIVRLYDTEGNFKSSKINSTR